MRRIAYNPGRFYFKLLNNLFRMERQGVGLRWLKMDMLTVDM